MDLQAFEQPVISQQMALVKIHGKSDVYKGMHANGYYMMAVSSSCCTLVYMDKVRRRLYWVPMY